MIKSIQNYIKWCQKQGLKPSNAQSLIAYKEENEVIAC